MNARAKFASAAGCFVFLSVLAALVHGGCPGTQNNPPLEAVPAEPQAGNTEVLSVGPMSSAGGAGSVVPAAAPSAAGSGGAAIPAPVVSDVQAYTQADKPVAIRLSGQNRNGIPLQFRIVSGPDRGALDPIAPGDDVSALVVFTPEAGFAGQAQFMYEATEDGAASNVGSVQIVVYPLITFELSTVAGEIPLTVEARALTVGGYGLPEGEYCWILSAAQECPECGRECGPMSTHASRTWVLSNAGTYSVTLSVLLAGLAGPVACTGSSGGDVVATDIRSRPNPNPNPNPSPGNAAPLADAGPDQSLVDANEDGSETVVLDGSRSTDADGKIVYYRWSIGAQILAESASATATVSVPVGTHDVGLYVRDDKGAPGQDTVRIEVKRPGRLAVSPGGYSAAGPVGGPFTPAQAVYRLQNTGETDVAWAVSVTQGWLSVLAPNSGSLPAGGIADVTVSINSASANSLAAGAYADVISFANWTNGLGDAQRNADLVVSAPQVGLVVSPQSAFASYGVVGGPFSPANQVYTLENRGSQALDWTASKTAAWLDLSAASGTLTASGTPTATATVTVSFNANANALGAGTYNDTVMFLNTTNGSGNTTRAVTLEVTTVQMAEEISQYGITWTFDQAYQVGQFVNGDWWVTPSAPGETVAIVSVTPGWDGQKHGSQLDPVPLQPQGFDSRVSNRYTFSAGSRAVFPLTVGTSDGAHSVVSTISRDTVYSGGTYHGGKTAAVLTVVAGVPPTDAFRPPYVGGQKPFYTASQLRWDRLPLYPVPAGVSLPNYSNLAKRVWLDHGPKVWGRSIACEDNGEPYPAYAARHASDLAILCMLDTPDRHELTVRHVQMGIDYYYISLMNDDGWVAQGGFGWGRKWPILFAGLMLDDANMMAPASTTSYCWLKFGEDGHTSYGQATPEYPDGLPLWGADCACVGINSPWYGNHDCRDPNGLVYPEELVNGGGYRAYSCFTVGQALAARLIGAGDVWNHPAYFEYVDRWVAQGTNPWFGNNPLWTHGSGLVKAMWNLYR